MTTNDSTSSSYDDAMAELGLASYSSFNQIRQGRGGRFDSMLVYDGSDDEASHAESLEDVPLDDDDGGAYRKAVDKNRCVLCERPLINGGDSVFDRLYKDAKKRRQRRRVARAVATKNEGETRNRVDVRNADERSAMPFRGRTDTNEKLCYYCRKTRKAAMKKRRRRRPEREKEMGLRRGGAARLARNRSILMGDWGHHYDDDDDNDKNDETTDDPSANNETTKDKTKTTTTNKSITTSVRIVAVLSTSSDDSDSSDESEHETLSSLPSSNGMDDDDDDDDDNERNPSLSSRRENETMRLPISKLMSESVSQTNELFRKDDNGEDVTTTTTDNNDNKNVDATTTNTITNNSDNDKEDNEPTNNKTDNDNVNKEIGEDDRSRTTLLKANDGVESKNQFGNGEDNEEVESRTERRSPPNADVDDVFGSVSPLPPRTTPAESGASSSSSTENPQETVLDGNEDRPKESDEDKDVKTPMLTLANATTSAVTTTKTTTIALPQAIDDGASNSNDDHKNRYASSVNDNESPDGNVDGERTKAASSPNDEPLRTTEPTMREGSRGTSRKLEFPPTSSSRRRTPWRLFLFFLVLTLSSVALLFCSPAQRTEFNEARTEPSAKSLATTTKTSRFAVFFVAIHDAPPPPLVPSCRPRRRPLWDRVVRAGKNQYALEQAYRVWNRGEACELGDGVCSFDDGCSAPVRETARIA